MIASTNDSKVRPQSGLRGPNGNFHEVLEAFSGSCGCQDVRSPGRVIKVVGWFTGGLAGLQVL
jgi:hypothetical protein